MRKLLLSEAKRYVESMRTSGCRTHEVVLRVLEGHIINGFLYYHSQRISVEALYDVDTIISRIACLKESLKETKEEYQFHYNSLPQAVIGRNDVLRVIIGHRYASPLTDIYDATSHVGDMLLSFQYKETVDHLLQLTIKQDDFKKLIEIEEYKLNLLAAMAMRVVSCSPEEVKTFQITIRDYVVFSSSLHQATLYNLSEFEQYDIEYLLPLMRLPEQCWSDETLS